MGTFYPPREVHDAAEGQQHVQHDNDDDQNTYHRREGSLEGAVVRAPVEPRHGEEEHDEDRGHHDGAEGDQGVAGEEHEHLLVEEEEPLRSRHVGDRRRVGRLGERRRR
jgi:hypothetical protein